MSQNLSDSRVKLSTFASYVIIVECFRISVHEGHRHDPVAQKSAVLGTGGHDRWRPVARRRERRQQAVHPAAQARNAGAVRSCLSGLAQAGGKVLAIGLSFPS